MDFNPEVSNSTPYYTNIRFKRELRIGPQKAPIDTAGNDLAEH